MSKTPNISKIIKIKILPSKFKIVACIPTYNEQNTIRDVILETLKHVEKVYVCDDGSTDNTVNLSEAAGAHVLRHEDRKGLAQSLHDLLEASLQRKPGAIVILEGDNPLTPEFIPDFVQPIKALETDIVIGTVREQSSRVNESNDVEAIGPIEENDSDETSVPTIQVISLAAAKQLYDQDVNIFGEIADEISYAETNGLRVKTLSIEIELDTSETSSEVEENLEEYNPITETQIPILPETLKYTPTEPSQPKISEPSTTKRPIILPGLNPRAISIVAIVVILAGAGIILNSGILSKPNYTLLIQPPEGSGSTNLAAGSHSFGQGVYTQIEATPAKGWRFNHWIIGDSTKNSTNPLTIKMNGDEHLRAVFNPVQCALTINTTGSGTTSPVGGVYTHEFNSTIKVTAKPTAGWRLDHWTLDGAQVGSDEYYYVTTNSNHTLSATFKQIQCRLDVNISGMGSIIRTPNSATYSYGTSVQLEAKPQSGWVFKEWGGDMSGVNDTVNLTLTSDKSITAEFIPSDSQSYYYTLTIQTQGMGTTNPGQGVHKYLSGSDTIVTATAGNGWQFDYWVLDGISHSSINPLILMIDSNHTLQAVFKASPTNPNSQIYTLMLNTIGSGTGSVSFNPSNWTYTPGTVITFMATPAEGSSFSGWSGHLNGKSNPIKLVMDSSKSVTANFTQNQYTLAITVTPSAGGTVSPNISPPYHYGDVITLTESPNAGYNFSGWSGDGTGSSSTRSVTVTGDMNVWATFTPIIYPLTISYAGSGGGSVTLNPSGSSYASGTVVTLTATPLAGSSFTGWSGDLSGTSNPINITMDSAKTVVAEFTLIEYTVSVSASPPSSGTVSLSPNKSTYHYGDIVILTATPLGNSTFTGWSGGLTGSTNPYTITIDSDLSVIALFN